MTPAAFRFVNAQLDFVAHLISESTRFAEAIASAPTDAAVPTSPDWNADDLLWHLGWVQSWWAMIVRENLTGPEAQGASQRRSQQTLLLLEAEMTDTSGWFALAGVAVTCSLRRPGRLLRRG